MGGATATLVRRNPGGAVALDHLGVAATRGAADPALDEEVLLGPIELATTHS